MSTYVRNGLGAGLALQTPHLQRDSGLRVLPLSEFPTCQSGRFGVGSSARLRRCFVDELSDRAKRIFGKAGSH